MGQHFPRGVGSPRQKAQGVGSSPVAQLCRGPSQVRKNAQKPATFLSTLPARPEALQGQAPGLNNPGKGRGGAELASAAGFSLQPHSAVQRQPSTACLSPASLPVPRLPPWGREEPPATPPGPPANRAAGSWVLPAKPRKSPWPREHQPMRKSPGAQKPRGLRKSPESPTAQRG